MIDLGVFAVGNKKLARALPPLPAGTENGYNNQVNDALGLLDKVLEESERKQRNC